MRANVGNLDRIIRFVLGVSAAGALFIGPLAASGDWGLAQFALAGASVILIGTSAVKFCPAYRIFGIRTCKVN